VHRGLGFAGHKAAPPSTPHYTTRPVAGYEIRVVAPTAQRTTAQRTSTPTTNRALGGGETRGGPGWGLDAGRGGGSKGR
jgi:hypothetical protein